MSNHELIDTLDRMDCRAIVEAILEELRRAKEKFPSWPTDSIHAAAIVAEESGELVRAALQYEYEEGSRDALQTEAIQVGAMAIRFLQNLNYD